MKAIHIAVKDLIITLRDWQGLLIFLVMPMVLTAILGAALSGNFTDTPTLSTFPVMLVDEDGGEFSHTLRDVLATPELQQLMQVIEVESVVKARELINSGKQQVALVVPAGFSTAVYAGEETSLQVLKDAGSMLRPLIVQGVASSFVEYISTGRVATVMAASKAMTGTVFHVELDVLSGYVVKSLQSLDLRFREEVAEPHRSLITSFQYYAAAMAVMFMMMSGSVGLESVAVEKRNLTWDRLLSSPTSPAHVVLGKFLAVFLVNTSQFIVLMLGTSLLYKVSWGTNIGMVLLAGACYAVAISGLSLLIASSVKTSNTALAVWNISVQVCAALGGSMVPLVIFPSVIQHVAKLSPNFWGIRMFTALMGGETLQLTHVLPLLSIGAVTLIIGGGQLILKQRRA